MSYDNPLTLNPCPCRRTVRLAGSPIKTCMDCGKEHRVKLVKPMLDAQQHYEAGMEEAGYMASETDEYCDTCGRVLLGYEVNPASDHPDVCADCHDYAGQVLLEYEERYHADTTPPF